MKYNEELKHCGIATFVGSEYEVLDNVKNYEVVVVGIPNEMGATYRLGMKDAPRAIREHSLWKKIDGIDCYDYDNHCFVKTNKVNICDVGDINIWHGNQEKTQEEIVTVISTIRKTSFPLILGGDHSISYGSFIGVKKGGNYQKLGLLQFDAHNDTEPDLPYFPRISHCNQFTKLIAEKHLDGDNMVVIGLRGMVNRLWHDFARENGITIITANEFNNDWENEKIVTVLHEKFAACDGLYVTFDMDALETSVSSGVGTPKYNGINFMKTLNLLRMLSEFNIVAFDLVELNPQQDASEITAYAAWEVLYNFLAVGYNKTGK